MKNNITRKTALKTICGLIILMLLSISNYSFAQVQNVPEGLYTDLGTLEDPIEVGELDFQWTFINETGCQITLAHWMSFNNNGVSHVKNGIVIPAANALGNGQTVLLNSTYLSFFGITGTNTLTNIAFQISVGAGYFFDLYPTTNTGNVMTSLPAPCNCFVWEPDFANKTFRIKKCL